MPWFWALAKLRAMARPKPLRSEARLILGNTVWKARVLICFASREIIKNATTQEVSALKIRFFTLIAYGKRKIRGRARNRRWEAS